MQYILCAPVGDPVGGGAGGSTIPSAIANARLDVSRVERAFVVPKTANDYIGQLIRFLLHLFDNHKGLIPDPYLAQMAMFNANDAHNTFQEKCTRKDGEDTRSELRGYIRLSSITSYRHERVRHITAHLRLMVTTRSHTKLYGII